MFLLIIRIEEGKSPAYRKLIMKFEERWRLNFLLPAWPVGRFERSFFFSLHYFSREFRKFRQQPKNLDQFT